MKWYYKNLVEKLNQNNNALDTSFEARISELHNQIKILEVQRTEVEDRLQNFLDNIIQTKEKNRYSNDVRACCQDLVLMGVGVEQVEGVIRSVLKNIAKVKVDS